MAFNYANVLNNIAQTIQQPRQPQQASQPQQSSGSKQSAGGSFADLLKQASASQQPQQQEAAPVYYEQPNRSSGSNKINTTSNEKEDSKKKESNESEESTPFRRGRSSIFMPEQAFATGENAATSEGGKAGENIPDNYIADPNAIAMPTGADLNQLTPEEQNAWARDRGLEFADLMATVATLPLGGIGGEAVAGLSAGGRAARAASAAADAAAATNKATKAAKAAKVGDTIMNASPEAVNTARNLMNSRRGQNLGASSSKGFANAVKAAEEVLSNPTAREQAIEGIAPYATPAMLAGTLGLVGALVSETANAAIDSNGDGNISQAERDNYGLDQGSNDKQNTDLQFTNEYQPSDLTQMQEYYNWLDTDDGRAFLERYGDEFGEDNQGYTNLRASQNRDAWADVMGFGEGEGIDNWQNRYTNSGVDLSDEHAMDNLMEYLYGDQAANLYDWIGNNDYNQSRVGISGDAYDEAALWFANQNPELMQAYNQEYTGGNDTFNADDFAYYALLTRLTNPEYGFNDVSIDELNRAAQAAGEGNTFGLTEQGLLGLLNDEGTSEESDRSNARRYLMNDNTVLNPWLQSDNPLMDQQMIDSVLAAYNAPKQKGSEESK